MKNVSCGLMTSERDHNPDIGLSSLWSYFLLIVTSNNQ